MTTFKTKIYKKRLARKRNKTIVIELAFAVLVVIITMGSITHLYDFMTLLPCNIDPANLFVPSPPSASVPNKPKEATLDKLNLKIVESTCWNGLIYADHLSAIKTTTNQLVWTKYQSGINGFFPDEDHNRLYVSGNEYIEAISIADGLTLWKNVSIEPFDHDAHPIAVFPDGLILVKLRGNYREVDPASGTLTATLPLSSHDFNKSSYISVVDGI